MVALAAHFRPPRTTAPQSKQFLSADPLGVLGSGEANVYGYAGNDPVNAADPDGLDVVRTTGSTQVSWVVQSPSVSSGGVNWQTSAARVSSTLPLGIGFGSTGVALQPNFGGGHVPVEQLLSAAASVFESRRDLSGMTRGEQERAVTALIQQQRSGRPGEWARGRVQEVMAAATQQAKAGQEAEQAQQLADARAAGHDFETIGELRAWNSRVESLREDYLALNDFEAGVIRSSAGVLTLVDLITPGRFETRDLLWEATALGHTTAGQLTEIGLVLSREAFITVATLGVGSALQAARAPMILTGTARLIADSHRVRYTLQATYAGLLTYEASLATQSAQAGAQAYQQGNYGSASLNFGMAGLGVLGVAGGGYSAVRRTLMPYRQRGLHYLAQNHGMGNSRLARQSSKRYFNKVKKAELKRRPNESRHNPAFPKNKEWDELHHWLFPQRARWVPNVIKHSPLNLKRVSGTMHARLDPYRFQFIKKAYKDLEEFSPYGVPGKLWYGTPTWAKLTVGTTGAVGGSYLAYMAFD